MTPRTLPRCVCLALVASTLALGLSACSQPLDSAPVIASHKVQLSPAAAAALPKSARIIGDYGSYRLAEVDDATLASLSSRDGVELRDDYDRILLNAATVHTRQSATAPVGRGLHLVQFAGPIRPEWHAALEATGVRVVAYVPNNAYLVWGEASALDRLDESQGLQFKGAYLDRYKLQPSLDRVVADGYTFQLVEDAAANDQTLRVLREAAQEELRIERALGYVNVVAKVPRARLAALAERPDVVSIHARPKFKLLDERQDIILTGQLTGNAPTGPGYLAWLTAKGFTQAQFDASGFGVDLSDSPVDNGTLKPNHFGLYVAGDITGTSRVAYLRLEGTPNSGSKTQGCDGHGNLNAHVIAGYDNHTGGFPFQDAAGFRYGLGVAPFVKIGSSIIFDPSDFTSPDYPNLMSQAYRDGMRISSNSWGGQSNSYDSDAQSYDALVRDAQPAGSAVPVAGNQEMVIVFAAGNNGPSGSSLGSPGTGKNIFTIGASEGVQAFGQSDGCEAADTDADSANDVAFFSSRGPTDDGRKKPDIMAPGSHISGGVAQDASQASSPPANPNGKAIACFTAEGVCGLADGTHYWPKSQQWYTNSTGTSHSTPAVSGATALLRQWFINNGRPVPSPAMTKAWFMNTAHFMTGSSANDTLPSNNQGMGLLNLSTAFDDTPRMLDDENPVNLFTASGQTRTFTGTISDSTRQFAVTLAWTDAPGSTTGNAWNNNLDLSVDIGGKSYKGNVFSGAYSIVGGSADTKDNVESVILPAGTSGDFTVTVTATNITSDGVPNNGTSLDQDFALVIYNVCQTAPATVVGVSATAVGDNRIDVSWTPNGAKEYHVYRSTTPGGPYDRVGTAVAPPWSDTTVSGGTTYYYVVRGKDCAESPNSTEVSATATGACKLLPQFGGLSLAQSAGLDTCTNTLTWAAATAKCGGSLSYSVYRDTTSGFTPSAANRIASGVSATSFSDTGDLVNGTTYYYVVHAVEVAGATVEEANTVQKSATAAGALQGGVSYLDDFDGNRPASAAAYWILSGAPANLGNIVTCRYQSATHAYRLGAASTACGTSYPENANVTLSLGGNGSTSGINGFAIAASAATPLMTFNIWYDVEATYDGVYLAYSTTAATGPWTAVNDAVSATAPYITAGGYDGPLESTTTRTWTGQSSESNGALKAVSVNLDAVKGKTVWFAFRFTSDAYYDGEGFYVDDVRISAQAYATCIAEPPGPATGFSIIGVPASIGAGAAASFDVHALDAKGHLATGYAGTASFTSSDVLATLPSPVTFSAGRASGLSATWVTLGTQTLTATDSVSSITGSASTVVAPGTPASLQFQQQPVTSAAGAAIPVQVKVLDAYGNATDAPSVALSLGNNPSGAKLSGTTTAATTNGVASLSVSLDKVGQGYTLVAKAGSLTATSATFDIGAGPAASLAFTVQPSTTAAGAPIAPAPKVALLDAFGNQTASTAQVTIALSAGPAGATLSGVLAVTASSGVASFSNASIDKVGQGCKLKASASGLTAADSAAFDVTPGAPDHVHFAIQPSTVVAGKPIAPAIQVAILDKFSNLATAATNVVTVALAANPSQGTLAGTASVSAVAGVATFADLSVNHSGAGYTLLASAAGVSANETSTAFDVLAGPPALLTFTVQPTSAKAGAAITPAVEVTAYDLAGNVATSATGLVTVSLLDNPGSAALGGSLTRSPVGGVARFADLTVDRVATGYSLKAEATGLTAATSARFDIAAGPPASLMFLVQPSPVQVGVAIVPAVRVALLDLGGNVVTTATDAITVSLGESPPGGTLTGTTTVAAVLGMATLGDLAVSQAGSYTLKASAGGLPDKASAAFLATTTAPARLVFAAQPHSAAAGSSLGAVRLVAQDADGKILDTRVGDVTVTLTQAGVTLDGTLVQALASGQAEFDDLSTKKAGTGYTLVASTPGLAGATSDAFDVISGTAASFTIDLPASVAAGAAVSYSATAVDQYGNKVSSYAGKAQATSSDTAATLDAAVWFVAGALSAEPVTFQTPGVASLTLADAADPSLRGKTQTTVTAYAKPKIAVTSPVDGASVSGSVSVTANGTVATGLTVKELKILVDGTALATGTSATLTSAWDTSKLAASSSHTLTATLTDSSGAVATSAPVKVTIGAVSTKQGCGCGSAGAASPTLALLAIGLFAAASRRRRR